MESEAMQTIPSAAAPALTRVIGLGTAVPNQSGSARLASRNPVDWLEAGLDDALRRPEWTFTWYRGVRQSRQGLRVTMTPDDLVHAIRHAAPHHAAKEDLPLICTATSGFGRLCRKNAAKSIATP
jgi:hypothetical protein